MNTKTQNTDAQTVNNATSKKLHAGFGLKVPANATANYLKNTISHSKSKNVVPFAPIYTGNGNYTLIGTGATIISPSGKLFVITQIVTKKSTEIGTTFKGMQFYMKWQTANGLFNGGHFAKYNSIKWGIANNTKGDALTSVKGLTKKQATELLKLNSLKVANINNIPSK